MIPRGRSSLLAAQWWRLRGSSGMLLSPIRLSCSLVAFGSHNGVGRSSAVAATTNVWQIRSNVLQCRRVAAAAENISLVLGVTMNSTATTSPLRHYGQKSASPPPPPPPPAPPTTQTSASPFSTSSIRILKSVLHHLWPKNNWKLRACVLVSISFMMVAKATRVAIPIWFKTVIDALAPGSVSVVSATVGPLTLGVFALVVGYGITRLTTSFTDEMKTAIFAPVGAHATTQVSMQLFKKIHELDLTFHMNRQTGMLAKDMDRGSRAFWSLAYALLFMVIPTAFEMTLVCAALQTQAGPVFVVTAVVAVVAYISWTYVVTNWRAKFRDQYNKAESKVGGLVVDSLMNYETVKYFGREQYEYERIGKETRLANKHLARLDETMAVLNFGQQTIFTVAATWCLYCSTCGVLAGTMTVGDLVLVDALLLQLYTPLSWLGMLYREVQTSTQNMEAMFKILDSKPLIEGGTSVVDSNAATGSSLPAVSQPTTAAALVPFTFVDGTIQFEDVAFSYPTSSSSTTDAAAKTASSSESSPPPRRDVLKHLTLTIPGGKCVAFVGPSGCGKSTIFRLLFRFFDPKEGRVLVDGQALTDVTLRSYRSHVGVIPQDTILFHDTVIQNIRYGRLDATDDECIEAAKAANVHESILHMADGYNTIVGERGLKLSGGEKQRVAIARAFLYNTPILLADEATSALDTKSETSIMRTLKGANLNVAGGGKKRTVILIAHRLSTVREADTIFVLNGQGNLAEFGTHDELLSRMGLYHSLWFQQLHEHHK